MDIIADAADTEGNNESNTTDAVDFGLAGLYPCWQNLPAVTAQELFETIAMCAGKMIQYNNLFLELTIHSWIKFLQKL